MAWLINLDQAIFELRYTFPKLWQICFQMASFGHLSVRIWINPFWKSPKLVRCPFATLVHEHLDRQASDESAFQCIGNAFGSTGVERERISTLRKRIWIDGRRGFERLAPEAFYL